MIPLLTGTLTLADQNDRPKLIELMALDHNLICFDTDEDDDFLEKAFPNQAYKTTVLCPPPKAMYALVDGDNIQDFEALYYKYLDDETLPAKDIIIMMIALLSKGANVMLYAPVESDDSIWIAELASFLNKAYGISIAVKQFPLTYDERANRKIIYELYKYGYMNVYDFLRLFGWFDVKTTDPKLIDSIIDNIIPYTGRRIDYDELQQMITAISKSMDKEFKIRIIPAVTYVLPPKN